MNIDIIDKPRKNVDEDIQVKSSNDIVNLKEVQEIRKAIREHLLFIGLDNSNNIRNISLIAIGTSNEITIDTKEIIRLALYSASNKIILVHNHPSNNIEPSRKDIHLTNITSKMLEVFNLILLDHIIVTEDKYISMEKIKKINRTYENQDISNMSKGLLIEENQRLKQQLHELQQKAQYSDNDIAKKDNAEEIDYEY